jgi:TRAP-type mannitol/chloroaromatic compound transport system substrate-binding protein
MKKNFKRLVLTASLGLTAFALTTGSVSAQDRKVRFQMAAAFGSTMPLAGEGAVFLIKKIQRASGGSIDIKHNEPNALVPVLQSFDAVSQGSVDMVWSTAGFWQGKDSTFNFFASLPYGPAAGEYLAWLEYGGGKQIMDELYGKYGVHALTCAMAPPEGSGWFRKEIKTLQDLKGLKMRFFGLGAKAMSKLGVSTQLIAPGEIYQALQLGTIDATEFSTPVQDLSLGFYQVAKFYYLPGWHQQSTALELLINKKKWDALSDSQKAIIEQACGDNVRQTLAYGESAQFGALKEIQAKGVTIKTWGPEFLAAFRKAWEEVAVEESANNPMFKKAWTSYSTFRNNYSIWRDNGYLKN